MYSALCRFFLNPLGVRIESCAKYSHCYWWQSGWFPFFNWLVLFFNVIGLVTSAGKFCDRIWLARIYNVLDGKTVTRARIVGSIIQLSSYILMFMGQITVNPIFMSPWIVIRAIALTFHFIFWIYEIRVAKISLRWQELRRFSRSFSFFLCVVSLYSVFYEAIDNGHEDFVELFKGAHFKFKQVYGRFN